MGPYLLFVRFVDSGLLELLWSIATESSIRFFGMDLVGAFLASPIGTPYRASLRLPAEALDIFRFALGLMSGAPAPGLGEALGAIGAAGAP